MPFIITQLSGYKSHFEEIRDAQRLASRQLPNVGLAVTIDIGDKDDIHPHNKTDVGYRLACEAERLCYGRKTVSAGPLCRSMEVKGKYVVLSFDNVGSGLVARGNNDGKLNHFEISDNSGSFFLADAQIQGDKVVVSSSKVQFPCAVRYAWLPYAADINFYNAEGFPASPFKITSGQ